MPARKVAFDDTSSTNEDTAVNVNVLANDFSTPSIHPTITSTSGTSALGAKITINKDGTINYDPTGATKIQALAQGEIKTDTFTYTINDGPLGSGTATVTVTLTGVNDAPTIVGTAASQPTTDTKAVNPFSTVKIGDVDNSASDSLKITLSANNGTLAGTGLTQVDSTTYTLAATDPGTLTTELEGLTFTPIAHQGAVGTTVTTNFTLAANDGFTTTTDAKTSVVTTESAASAGTIIAYTVTLTDVPNAHNTEGSDINDNGEVVGIYFSPRTVTGDVISDGYTYINGKITTIDRPGATNTELDAVNNEGDLAGQWNVAGSTAETGFVEHNGFFTDFSVPNATLIIRGINNSQVVVGSEIPNIGGGGQQGGFTYDNVTGNVTLIQHGTDATAAFDINDSGVVVGSYFNGIDHGFLFQNGTFTPFNISDPSGVRDTEILAINDKGDFAGTYHEGNTTHGFLHTGDPSGGSTTLFEMSDITGLSDDDVVSGRSSTGAAAVYTNGKVINLNINGGSGGVASAINNNNVVAGTILDSAGIGHGFYGTPVIG